MSALAALIRSSVLLAGAVSVACAPPVRVDSLESTETIVGRTVRNGHIVLLTDAPALLLIDPATARLSRQPILAADGAVLKPWGLAEHSGSLFTVSGFVDLRMINDDGLAKPAARLARPVSNLIDLDDQMAAQYAAAGPSAPLVVSLAPDGRLNALESPARGSSGLSPVEEDVVHLLTCSAPARVVCWLPHRASLFEKVEGAFVVGTTLQGVTSLDVPQVISGAGRRLFDDVLPYGSGRYLVLHRPLADEKQSLTLFDSFGSAAGTIRLHEPLRLLIAADGASVLALARSGRLTKVNLPW